MLYTREINQYKQLKDDGIISPNDTIEKAVSSISSYTMYNTHDINDDTKMQYEVFDDLSLIPSYINSEGILKDDVVSINNLPDGKFVVSYYGN